MVIIERSEEDIKQRQISDRSFKIWNSDGSLYAEMSEGEWIQEPGEEAEVLNIDAILENADWTKQSWDLPKYKSKEFYDWLKFSGMTIEQFKKLPVYKLNLANGTIKE